MGAREMAPTDYLSQVYSSAGNWFGQIGSFMSEQTRERPLLIGAILFGIIGAVIGARVAQMQAMMRRKSALERAMDMMGFIGSTIAGGISGYVSRRPRGAIDTLRDRGQEVMSTTIESISPMVRPRRPAARGLVDTIQQVGYALSLIPIAVAFLRNPLVRDMGMRYLFRRVSRR